MVAERLAEVRGRIEAAAVRSGRDPSAVTLVVVTKSRSVREVLAAYEAGHRDFGENRAEELAEKAPQLPGDIRWHFIGTVQRRKIALARPLSFLLQSMDRLSLARRWASAPGEAPPCLLQVNIGLEPQKHGVAPAAAAETLDEMAQVGIIPVGLMAIPPAPDYPGASRRHFAALAELADGLGATHPRLVELSMGMTDDFEEAVEVGATIVRVGRAIFGSRTE